MPSAAAVSETRPGRPAGPGGSSSRSMARARRALSTPILVSLCAAVSWPTRLAPAASVMAVSRAASSCTARTDRLWASTSCRSRARRERSASAAARSLASPAAVSCASSASAWRRAPRLAAANSEIVNRNPKAARTARVVAAGLAASIASTPAIAATIGLPATMATRGGMRRARPTTAM